MIHPLQEDYRAKVAEETSRQPTRVSPQDLQVVGLERKLTLSLLAGWREPV